MATTVVHRDLKSLFGDRDLLEIAQARSFSSLIFELLSEKVPTNEQLRLFEFILNVSIDHGPETPSAVKVIEEAQNGETISEAVAEGVEQINDTHGGAITPAMEWLYKLQKKQTSPKEFVVQQLAQGQRIAGMGHRIYTDLDPRAQLILKKLKEINMGDEFINLAQEVEIELTQQKGKKLPLNIDCAIAVVLCSFGWSSKLGKAVFIIARTPGLCGQYLNATE